MFKKVGLWLMGISIKPRVIQKRNIIRIDIFNTNIRLNHVKGCYPQSPKEMRAFGSNIDLPRPIIAKFSIKDINPNEIFIIQIRENIFGHKSRFGCSQIFDARPPPPLKFLSTIVCQPIKWTPLQLLSFVQSNFLVSLEIESRVVLGRWQTERQYKGFDIKTLLIKITLPAFREKFRV